MRVSRYMAVAGLIGAAMAGAALAAETQGTIPEAFQGKWSQSAATCADKVEDVHGVRVTGATITFYEARGSIRSVKILSADAIEVEADWSGEGRRWSAANRLSLSQSGQALTITGFGRSGQATSVRCQ